MLTGINAEIRRGYTGNDHMIEERDESAATNAVAGVRFARSADALKAAEAAYAASCDRSVCTARVQVTLRTARGDRIIVG